MFTIPPKATKRGKRDLLHGDAAVLRPFLCSIPKVDNDHLLLRI
jgi:hypothetical protein